MVTVTGFADEISPDFDEQLDVMEGEGIRFIELRGANKKNVIAFTKEECAEFKKKMKDRGFGISAIGSPIGKVKIDDDFNKHMDDFKHAMELAKFFETPNIRLFTYYPPEGKDINDYRDEVIRRMKMKVKLAEKAGIMLLSENEGGVFAESPENAAYVIEAVNSPNLKNIFDPANFVLHGYDVLQRCWPLLKKHTVYFHIKDAVRSENRSVPAGEGEGRIKDVLSDAIAGGFTGFLSLEPHLHQGGQFSGFSGPDKFRLAVRALKKVLDEIGVQY